MGMAAISVMWPKPFELTSISWKHHMKFGFNQPNGYWGKRNLKILNVMSDLDQGPWMTLTFGTHKASCTHLVDFIQQYNSFWKIHCFNFFPYKSVGDQTWPCPKIGQGQSRVIIWTILVEPEYPMLHTKFQVICLLVPEKILKGFYHTWAWGLSWSCDLNHLNNFRCLIPRRLHMKFGFNQPGGYWGKEVWKYWIWVTWTKVSEWFCPLVLIKLHGLIQLTSSTNTIVSEKSIVLTFSHTKA